MGEWLIFVTEDEPRDTVKRKRRDLAPFPKRVRALARTPVPGVDRTAVTNY